VSLAEATYRCINCVHEFLGGFGEYLRVLGAFEGLRAFKRSWEVLRGI